MLQNHQETSRIVLEELYERTQKEKQINIEIGMRIKQIRTQRKITQEQLAEMIDVTVQYISDLERGVTGSSVATIVKLCQVLDVSSDYILLGKEGSTDPQLQQKLNEISPAQKNAILEILEKVLALSNNNQ